MFRELDDAEAYYCSIMNLKEIMADVFKNLHREVRKTKIC